MNTQMLFNCYRCVCRGLNYACCVIALIAVSSEKAIGQSSATTYSLRELADINLAGSSFPGGFTPLGKDLFFAANDVPDDLSIRSLYRTDGLSVSKIPGGHGLLSSTPFGGDFFEFNGDLYYTAAQSGGYELFRANSTRAEQVADINPEGGSLPRFFHVFNDELYFVASGPSGEQLYKTDGDDVIFQALGEDGAELYKSNGISVEQLADINPMGHSEPTAFTAFHDESFFRARGPMGYELYKTDGESVTLVADLNQNGDSRPTFLRVHNNSLFFAATDSNGNALFRTDGVDTTRIVDLPSFSDGFISNLVPFREHLLISMTGVNGRELFAVVIVPEPTTLNVSLVAVLISLIRLRPQSTDKNAWRPC